VKEIKRVWPKDGILEILGHKSPFSIGERVSFSNFEQFLYIKSGLFKLGTLRKSKKKIKKVSSKYENFQILEHKSPMSIGQHVYLWNYEHFLNIKYGFIKLSAVKNSKSN